jgi:hypothetical protein
MAQTKKRRRTKHRGNAAGMVESRGRTGRRPADSEKASKDAPRGRVNRLENPPTWRSAFNRSLIAAAFFAVLMVLVLKREPLVAIIFSTAILFLYVPITFYTDQMLHRRYLKKKQTAKAKA